MCFAAVHLFPVCVCVSGYTLFVEDESARANALLSRGDMEAVMVVHLAGRSAEKLVMGEGEVSVCWVVLHWSDLFNESESC